MLFLMHIILVYHYLKIKILIYISHLVFRKRKDKWKVIWNIDCTQFTEKLSFKMASAILVTETQKEKSTWIDNTEVAIYLQVERFALSDSLVRLPDMLFKKYEDVCFFTCQMNWGTMLCCELHGLKLLFLPSKLYI